MTRHGNPCPMPRPRVIDEYFLEHRSKIIDVAAFLDRVDRAPGGGNADEDFRIDALGRAIALLIDGQPNRARRILELLSDPTTQPLPAAATQAAAGAPANPPPATEK